MRTALFVCIQDCVKLIGCAFSLVAAQYGARVRFGELNRSFCLRMSFLCLYFMSANSKIGVTMDPVY
ncbi:hypothetical protein BKA69DRAFT_1078587 [Paraphysoderma sedebokerense]|nr:hypothetical protein BKA69DRAFT_1078587 [Paraphysoderma sedebokerense]